MKSFTVYCVGISLSLIVFFPASQAQAYLQRTLRLNSWGADVLELQRFLNTDRDTQIASSGAGSPGNETSFFGSATLAAVIRFQQKHSDEVLKPAGLVSPTGVVGVMTRNAINKPKNKPITTERATNQDGPDIVQTHSNTATTTEEKKFGKPIVFGLESQKINPSYPFVIGGKGFVRGVTKIYLGSNPVEGCDITAGIISCQVPPTLGDGDYRVRVVNDRLEAEKSLKLFIEKGFVRPHVSKFPSNVSINDRVEIEGEGFDVGDDNRIRSMYGTIDHAYSPDGKILSFSVSDLSDFEKVRETINRGKQVRLPMMIFARNATSNSFAITIGK